MKYIIDGAIARSSPERLKEFLQIIESDIDFLRAGYPNFEGWLYQTVLPGLQKSERSIVLERTSGGISGFMILKHSNEESKLCTLRVRTEHENKGIGVRFFKTAFEILETDQPLLSVSERAMPKFKRIFDYFGFEYAASYKNLYLPGAQEFSYNGLLLPKKENKI